MQSVIFVDVRRCLPGQCGNVIASRYDCAIVLQLSSIILLIMVHVWKNCLNLFTFSLFIQCWLHDCNAWSGGCMHAWMDGFMDVCRLSSFVLLVLSKEAPLRMLLSAGTLSNVIVSKCVFSEPPTPNLMLLTMWDDECHSLVAPACNIPYYYANLCSTLIWYLGVIATKFPSGLQVLIIRRICQPVYNMMIFKLSVLEGPCWRFCAFCSLLVKFEGYYKQSWSCFMVIWVQ